MMLTRRRFAGLAALSLLFLLIVALRAWFQSQPARQAALRAIGQIYDGHVDVDTVAVGLSGITLRGIRLRETRDPDSAIVCSIPDVDLTGPPWQLVRGDLRLASVTLNGPSLRVARTPAGNWSLNLPLKRGGQQAPVPIHVRNASLELAWPELPGGSATIQGIKLDLVPGGELGDLRFSGEMNDPAWGRWRVSGRSHSEGSGLSARVQATRWSLRQEHAMQLGGPAKDLYAALRPRGQVDVEADVSLDLTTGSLDYSILIDPLNATVDIPSIPSPVRDVAGRIEITPDRVHIQQLVGRLASGAVAVSGTISRTTRPRFDLSLDVADVSVADFLEAASAGGVTPLLSGRVRLQGMPDPATWSGGFDGCLRLRADGAPDVIELHAAVRDNSLVLDDVTLPWGGGTITARGHVGLRSDARVEGAIELDNVALASLLQLDGAGASRVAGSVAGRLHFAVPPNAWADRSQWQWSGPVRISHAVLGDVEFDSVEAEVASSGQSIRLRQTRATTNGWHIDGDVELETTAPHRVTARFWTAARNVRELTPAAAGAALQVGGQLVAEGTLTGTLVPERLAVRGAAIVQALSVCGVDLGDVPARYTYGPDRLEFESEEFDALGGRARLGGEWSWVPSLPPRDASSIDAPADSASRPVYSERFAVRADFTGLDMARLAGQLPNTNCELRGRASGHVELETGDAADGSPRVVGHVDTGRARLASLDLDAASLEFTFADGRFAVPSCVLTLPAGTAVGSAALEYDGDAPVLVANLSSQRLDIEQLASRAGGRAPPIRGDAAVTLSPLRVDLTSGSVRATGTCRCGPLLVDGCAPIESMMAGLDLEDSRLVLSDCRAQLWGGTAHGTVTIDLSEQPSSLATVAMDRVDQAQVRGLARAWPAIGDKIAGRMSGKGTLEIRAVRDGFGVVGRGSFQLSSGTAFGLPVRYAKGTIEAWNGSAAGTAGAAPGRRDATSDVGQKLRIVVQESDTAGGTATGEVAVSCREPVEYDASFRFERIDLETFVRSMFASPHQGGGALSGHVRLHGTDRGAADTVGFVRLSVRDADLWPYPVFAVLAKTLSLDLTNSGAFRSGEGEAVIRNGTLTFRELKLASDVVQLFGDGTVGLDGRIKLKVVGNVQPAIPKGVPVLGRLQGLVSFLQQRLVQVHLNGTLDDPTAVPVPLQDVSEPAMRFFKGVLTGTKSPADTANSGSPQMR